MARRLKFSSVVFLVSALFMLLGVLRLNDLSVYNPDSARYLIWGTSLAQGKGFVDATQPEPDRYVVHAPLYALMIAPVEFFLPNSLTAVKIASILWGVLALFLFYYLICDHLGRTPAIVGVILLAFNPLTLVYATEVLSEIPFLVFMLLILILAGKLVESSGKGAAAAVPLVIALSLLPLLREIGVAFVAAIVVTMLLAGRWRNALLLFLGPALLVAGWYVRNQILVSPSPGAQPGNFSLLAQHFATGQEAPILSELMHRVWIQAEAYVLQLSGMILYPQYATPQVSLIVQPSALFTFFDESFRTLKFAIVPILVGLMSVGVYADIRRSASWRLRLFSAVTYVGGILLYPVHDVRFLFPLLPLVIFYALSGSKLVYRRYAAPEIEGIPKWNARFSVVAAFAALAVLPNLVGLTDLISTNLEYRKSPVLFYQRLKRLNDYPPIFAQPWSFLASWIRQHTPGDAVIASSAKDIAPMVESRKILELDPGVPLPEFERILRDYAVSYLIATVRWDDLSAYEFQMNESRRLEFEQVYSAGNLRLFRISSAFFGGGSRPIAPDSLGDSLSAGGLLKRGRALLVRGELANASAVLERALGLAPNQPEVVFQYAVAHAFLGNENKALKAFSVILSLPQAGSYLYATRRHIEAMNLLDMRARQSEEAELRVHEAASIYWHLGYPLRAEQIMEGALRNNSQYFFGMLWGFHYAFQNGDVPTAKAFYERLTALDSSNAVVHVFRRILEIHDIPASRFSGLREGRLYLEQARLYQQIELFEEAIDEAERAARAGADRDDVLAFLVKAYELKKSPRGMARWLSVALSFDSSRTDISARLDSLRKVLSP